MDVTRDVCTVRPEASYNRSARRLSFLKARNSGATEVYHGVDLRWVTSRHVAGRMNVED